MKRERDDVYAVQEGKVLYALKTPSAYGYRIYIKHNDNSTAMYGHLSKILVREGQVIRAGDLIGKIGETGNCPSGKHLHINYFSKYAKSLTGKDTSDPTYWIKLNYYPTNTKCSGGFHEVYTNNKTGEQYLHEGLDLSYNNLIEGWAEGNINSMIQDLGGQSK